VVVPSDDYGIWIRMGLALKNSLGNSAFSIWHEWSAKSSNYGSEDECRKVWDGFEPDGSLGIGAVFYEAQQKGWNGPSNPVIRKMNAYCWGVLVRFLLKFKARDVDCAFKIYPRKLFEEIEMTSMGALIDAEILAKAAHLGYRIDEVGVYHYPRMAGEQTGANLKVILRAFKELFFMSLRLRSEWKRQASAGKKAVA